MLLNRHNYKSPTYKKIDSDYEVTATALDLSMTSCGGKSEGLAEHTTNKIDDINNYE